MLIAIIVLAAAVLILGIGFLFLLKINQAHAETNGRLQTYSQGLIDTIQVRESVIADLESENAHKDEQLKNQLWELDAAHKLLERVVVLVPDDASSLVKGEEKAEDEPEPAAEATDESRTPQVEIKEEVVSTSTEKDNTE